MSERKKKRKKGNVIANIVLVIAIIVFVFCACKLGSIFYGYYKGDQEYNEIKEAVVKETEEGRFTVDFEELWKVNQDIIGWIRFDQPDIINYPVVQGKDNQEYLDKTISGYPNTYGAIFLNVYNHAEFTDKNSIIYGHRMNSKSMFGKLEEYQSEEFYKQYPYFYLYTPDGKELKYQIYSVGIVKDTSESYQTQFLSDEEFQAFVETTKAISFYDTGVEVPSDAQVVTLSTCTEDNNDERLVVHGIKIEVN